jgi:uncharacterized protein with ParB-like and HNH nuclease domain
MSNITSIQTFLMGKNLRIPNYQRDYAWRKEHVEALLSDISDVLETNTDGHYMGTIVIAKANDGVFEVVDGQQRLTTITLVLRAFLNQLTTDLETRYRYANEYALLLTDDEQHLKINFGKNKNFISDLFLDKPIEPQTAGQRRLKEAYNYTTDRAKAVVAIGGESLIKKWVDTLKRLEIIAFEASSTGKAIRLFQTVNDRGMPLSVMDKAKALLMSYSNQYLDAELDDQINEAFGVCFNIYDGIREFARRDGFLINNLARDRFSEDDIMRYHYLSYSYVDVQNGAEYDAPARFIFDSFLKKTLENFAKVDRKKLKEFISDYVADLANFSQSFLALIKESEHNVRLYKLFVILGMAARLYPLVIRLNQRAILFSKINQADIDLLHCLEVCDVRVYKTRNTDPARDIGNLSHKARTLSVTDIANGLRDFTKNFMWDSEFKAYLARDMYRNGAVRLMLLTYDENLSREQYSHEKLKELVTKEITREHVVAQTPNASIDTYGFTSEEDFQSHLHLLGNMTLLSKSENSSCSNIATYSKLTNTDLYASSIYAGTRLLAHNYQSLGESFNKDEIEKRTEALSDFVTSVWAIW